MEAPYVIESLRLNKSDKVLDVASPKHVALFIRAFSSDNVTSLDISSDYMESYKKYEKNLGLKGISWEVQDARGLKYKDASFDKVYSISVMEHIPADGDILAMREIGRVLKPGGICAITVPFSGTAKEIYKNTKVYEREYAGTPVFFSRYYDMQSVSERLVIPSGLKEIDRCFFRARFGLESSWNRLPRQLQMLLHWAGPIFSFFCYEKAGQSEFVEKESDGFCCITLMNISANTHPEIDK